MSALAFPTLVAIFGAVIAAVGWGFHQCPACAKAERAILVAGAIIVGFIVVSLP